MGERGRQPGGEKTPGSGRKIGSLNKDTTKLCELLEEYGYDPVADLVWAAEVAKAEFARAAEIHDAIQGKRMDLNLVPTQDSAFNYLKVVQNSALGIMGYKYPRRKALEVSGHVEVRSVAEIMRQAHEEKAKLIVIDKKDVNG